MVKDEEVSYIFDCLKCINNSIYSYGLEQLAVDEGLCAQGNFENFEPEQIVRMLLEYVLQSKSRNGSDGIFVMRGRAFSSGYKKKVPLHMVLSSAPIQPEDTEIHPKAPTMTVLWDWNVKLECDEHAET